MKLTVVLWLRAVFVPVAVTVTVKFCGPWVCLTVLCELPPQPIAVIAMAKSTMRKTAGHLRREGMLPRITAAKIPPVAANHRPRGRPPLGRRKSALVVMFMVEEPLVVEPVRSTLVGFSEQETCVLELVVQAKFTVSVKPFDPETVMVAEPGAPVAGVLVSDPPIEKSGAPLAASHAVMRLATSSEPRPVTWSYPVPAENPMVVVPDGQFLLPEVHGTLLSPEVMS